MSFVHLHTHTEYSLLDGSNKIKEYVKRVKDLGMNAAAITDHGVMYGVIDFYEAALEAGIKPVIGCEIYVAPGSRFDKEAGGEERYHHLVLLAENNTGYENLCRIVSKGFTEGYYYRPRVDFEVLQKYHEGLICTSACLAGELPRLIEKGMLAEARACAIKYRDCFGEGNYFLELQDHGIGLQTTVNMEVMKISKELGIPLVATNDVHYTYAEDADAHDVLLCIQTGKKLTDEDRMKYEGGQYYVKSEEEMRTLFPYAPEALENTQKIADRCNVTITFGETKLPHFEVPEGFDSWTYLNHLCNEGLKERYPDNYKELEDRLNYELSVIKTMGFVDYFLIVWDFINYAKSNDIMVGPGRGSAAGSIVSYCLKITNIDPIKYSLLFERFLNPERVSMPDIDIDFCFERRQEVIEYVGRKYGHEKVVQIVTFGTMLAKGVIRDVGRVLDLPYAQVDAIAKMIPQELGITISKALTMNPEFKALYDTDEQMHSFIDMAMRLEGLPRHTSMHAAGVVICPKAADEFVPLSRGSDGSITTQYTMVTLERLGLLKMDFLGLRTLTVIQNAVRNVAKTHGIKLDIDNINYDDKAVLESLHTGRTDGVFQLESAGMKSFMKELKPGSIEDLIAGISLYRPGPMDFIPKYIDGKNDSEHISYACPELEPILSPTYGCIVYQEQVMQIVRELGGYTMGRSDNVRRAMSKKKVHVMEHERDIFINGNDSEIEEERAKGTPEDKLPKPVAGCVRNGISPQVADGIYGTMMDFAKYAFNKSHAACYAVVAYQTAYLKHYYPVEFMAALITSVVDNSDKVSEYIGVCRKMGIDILPPDINSGDVGFSVEDKSIIYSLTAIKGVGRNVIEALVHERQENGLYKDIRDFIVRNSNGEVNKRAVENFIKAGAFDCFNGNRRQLMSIYTAVMDSVQNDKKHNMAGQMTLFDMVSDEEKASMTIELPKNMPEYDKEMLLAFEKEVLGVYVSGHPLENYAGLWDKKIQTKTIDFSLDDETGLVPVGDKETVTLAGMITGKTIKYTKRNETMAFFILEDLYGSVEVIAFPKSYSKYAKHLTEDAKVVVKGRSQVEEDKDGKLILEDAYGFENLKATLWLQFENEDACSNMWPQVYDLLKDSDGHDRVKIYIASSKEVLPLAANNYVCADKNLTDSLKKMLGDKNVIVSY